MRAASGAFRGEAGASPPSRAAARGANDPFNWPDDPVSRAVRASCDVVESAVRRGFGLGGSPGSGAAPGGPVWGNGRPGPWTTGQWVDAMTGAFGLWAQWMDVWAGMARAVMSGEPGRVSWPPGVPSPSPPGSPSSSGSPSPPASPAASPSAGALRVTVELRTPRAASVQLDLSSLPTSASTSTSASAAPAAPAALEIHGLLAPPAAAAPPITDVTVTIADGGAVISLGSLDQHPAATYVGAVLCGGRACGTLTVRLS